MIEVEVFTLFQCDSMKQLHRGFDEQEAVGWPDSKSIGPKIRKSRRPDPEWSKHGDVLSREESSKSWKWIHPMLSTNLLKFLL